MAVFGPSIRNRFGKPATVRPRCACAPARPGLAERAAAAPGDGHRWPANAARRSRWRNQHVERVLAPVGGDDAARRDALDGRGDQLDVRLRQRRVEVVRVDDALAAQRVGRRAALARRASSATWRSQVCCGRLEHAAPRQRAFVEAAPAPFEHGVPERAHRRGVGRNVRERRGRARCSGRSRRGSTQLAVRWNTCSAAACSASGGISCDAVEPVPMTRHALARQRRRRVPACRVQPPALEALQARDVGPARLAQRAGAADEEARAQRWSPAASVVEAASGRRLRRSRPALTRVPKRRCGEQAVACRRSCCM